MGRGRQKAKQAKVARELKYRTPDTDLDSLARELHAEQGTDEQSADEHQYVDEYEEWADTREH